MQQSLAPTKKGFYDQQFMKVCEGALHESVYGSSFAIGSERMAAVGRAVLLAAWRDGGRAGGEVLGQRAGGAE